MIDDKKLLCTFIYSAYKSGYCGLKLSENVRNDHLILYEDFIKGMGRYPEREINDSQGKMMNSIGLGNVRDYIYKGHLDVVKDRIEQEMEVKFEEALKNTLSAYPALNCPVNYYKVIGLEGDHILGKNLFLPIERRLSILEGLESPNIGDIVSGHWDYFLEILDPIDFGRYKEKTESYIDSVKKSIKQNK